jgi:hypothetical protein
MSFALGAKGDQGLTSMIEQCHQISRKRGERNVFGMLLDQIDTLHQQYLKTPEGCTWGDSAAIWNKQPPRFKLPPELMQPSMALLTK